MRDEGEVRRGWEPEPETGSIVDWAAWSKTDWKRAEECAAALALWEAAAGGTAAAAAGARGAACWGLGGEARGMAMAEAQS